MRDLKRFNARVVTDFCGMHGRTQTELLKMMGHGFGHKPHINQKNPPVFWCHTYEVKKISHAEMVNDAVL